MKETMRRLGKIFLINAVKVISLLLAVSVIAFALVCASPVDPVSQYITSLGTAVSSEQRAELEAYWGVNEGKDVGYQFIGVNENTSFYINTDGNVVIFYQEYEVAPGFMGSQEFVIPAR